MSKNEKPCKTILLVDDDAMHLEITKLSLENEYKILTAKSGAEALELLNSGKAMPDLIMLDILMPEMDGWVVFERIGNIASLEFTPIMFYTSLEEADAVEKAYELGVFDFVRKPCASEELKKRIKGALEKAVLKRRQYGI